MSQLTQNQRLSNVNTNQEQRKAGLGSSNIPTKCMNIRIDPDLLHDLPFFHSSAML